MEIYAIRALKKRLSGNRNYREVMLGLTVLETCVKNCGHRFHVFVANRDFIDGVLVKIISPKTNPPTIATAVMKTLHPKLVQTPQTNPSKYSERRREDTFYLSSSRQELKRKGIEFPMADLDALSPIHTPHRGLPEVDPAVLKYKAPVQPHAAATATATATLPKPAAAPAPAPAPAALTPVLQIPHIPNIARLRSELDIVRGNTKVMSEMLTEMVPGQEDSSDLELLQELNRTCRAMQQRVVELISRVSNEEVTEELLHVNDDLNNIFLRYERYERYRSDAERSHRGQPDRPNARLARCGQPPSHPHTTIQRPPRSRPQGWGYRGCSLPCPDPGPDPRPYLRPLNSVHSARWPSVKYEDPRALGGLASALDVRQQNTTGGLRVIGDDNPELELPIDSWLITQGMVRTPSSVSSPLCPVTPSPISPLHPWPPRHHPSIPLTIHIPALINQLAPTVEWRHIRKSQTTPPIVQYPHNDE
ncbi:unnamed protein product, partial [Coregonus sp. 'balchen']